MTDKTDIAALRVKAANVIGLLTAESLTGSFALDSLADVFDDMFRLLEAERQRADNASFRENHLNDMLNDKIQQNVDLRAELAALKVKLANPVVLPARFKPEVSKVDVFKGSPVMKLDATGGWLNRTGVIVALNEAGFAVKE